MEFMLQFDLNLFAIILLTALLVVILFKRELNTVHGKIFRYIILVTILLNGLEILSWIFNGKEGNLNYFFNFFFNFLFTLLNTMVVSLWISYIDYMIHEDVSRLKRRIFYFHPSIVMIVLSIINIFYPILFIVDDENIYARLPLIWISITMTFIIYFYTLNMVLRNRRTTTSKVLLGVLIFLLLPMIAALLQLWFYGLLLIWPVTAVALIFSYLIFETTSSNRDFLTGAYTRMRAEEFIETLLSKKRLFSVVMIDLDDFKEVNDTFGHSVGDTMLIEMTRVLNDVFNKKAIVSRFGGDEFIVVVEGLSDVDLQQHRKQIKEHLESSSNQYATTQKFSFGVAYCNDFSAVTKNSIITQADNNMYLDKAKNKNYKRRKSDH